MKNEISEHSRSGKNKTNDSKEICLDNSERISMPDIDIDFQDKKSNEVIECVKQHHGEELKINNLDDINETNGYIKTDDFQYQKKLDEGLYHMIGADELLSDVFPEDMNYVLYRGEINLNDYSEKEIESIIKGYYQSMEEMERYYPDKEVRKGIIAECIFEQIPFFNQEYLILEKEEDVNKQIETWLVE